MLVTHGLRNMPTSRKLSIHKIPTLAILVLVFLVNWINAEGMYSEEVSNLFQELSISDKCLDVAKDKSEQFNSLSRNKEKAIQFVNIYTQECKDYKNSDGKSFYETLNSNLRSGNPPPIWEKTSVLLSEGLVFLGVQNYSNLFRGCYCQNVRKDTQFSFKQFASTSTDANVGLIFAKNQPGKSFIHIINTNGTYIEPYTHFPGENEVLLPPNLYLSVIQVETDVNRISKEIKNLLPQESITNDFKMFVKLDGSRMGRKKRSSGFTSTCECGNPFNKASSQHAYGRSVLVVIVSGVILQHIY